MTFFSDLLPFKYRPFRSICVVANGITSFFFYNNNIPLYKYMASSLFIHLLMDI